MPRKRLGTSTLERVRQDAGLSQRALAKRARTAQSVIARIELGETSPSVDTLQRLVAAAGFELDLHVHPKPVLDRQLLEDVPRILRLSPEDRLREVANVNHMVATARRA